MRKKTTTLSITLILLVSFLISSGQPKFENYSIVTLKGDIIKNTLTAYPAFSYFDFTFRLLSDNNYSLQGYAKDNAGNQLGKLITFDVMTGQTKKLKNLQKGHLYLDLATMKSNNVDGAENYVLTPKKCKDKSGNSVDYVSYRFSNKVDPTSVAFLEANALKAFDLNPSPPY
jgi:hypothetical protein